MIEMRNYPNCRNDSKPRFVRVAIFENTHKNNLIYSFNAPCHDHDVGAHFKIVRRTFHDFDAYLMCIFSVKLQPQRSFFDDELLVSNLREQKRLLILSKCNGVLPAYPPDYLGERRKPCAHCTLPVEPSVCKACVVVLRSGTLLSTEPDKGMSPDYGTIKTRTACANHSGLSLCLESADHLS